MSGRPKKEVYEYTTEGVYIRTYKSISEARQFHYPEDLGSRPIFVKKINGNDFHVTKSNTILITKKIYRNNIIKSYKIWKSKLCNFYNSSNSNKIVQMFNLKGELLAEFSSMIIARIILAPEYATSTIYSQSIGRRAEGIDYLSNDFYFKFK